MAVRLVNVDRDTPMLLPPDLRDWLPGNHIARFIVDAVETLPLGGFRMNWRGSGSEQYPPSMMEALLKKSVPATPSGMRWAVRYAPSGADGLKDLVGWGVSATPTSAFYDFVSRGKENLRPIPWAAILRSIRRTRTNKISSLEDLKSPTNC